MGCGRSRHSSPTLTTDALSFKGDNKENRRGGKRQKLSDKTSKSAGKNESTATPTKTTNGKMGGAKGDSVQKGGAKQPAGGARQQGGRGKVEEAAVKREWQLEEAVETPETVVAVYRSSVSAFPRAAPQTAATAATTSSTSITSTTTTSSVNGSLINGAHRTAVQEISVPDKTAQRDRATTAPGNAKPVHVTSSQLEFFRMLDEKIEGGPDYISDED